MSLIRSGSKVLESVGNISTGASVVISLGLLLVAGALDWATGPELASSLFYLVPVAWVTWRAGRWMGLLMALTSGVTWLGVELASHSRYLDLLIPIWNAFVRTAIFILVSGLETEVLERKRVARRLRQANEAMQKQSGILQSILDSMADGVLVVDSDGKPLHINPAARRALAIPGAEREVVTWFQSQESFSPNCVNGQNTLGNPLLRAARGETVEETEMFLEHASLPEGLWLSVTGRPLRDSAGHLAGGVVVFSDISARKKLERQLAEVSDREQRRLGEDLHDGLCQHLVSTAFAARGLAAKLADRSLPESSDAAEIARLLGEAISQARDVARGLCLVPLEAGGLASALEEFALQAGNRHRVACEFVEKASIPALEEAVGANLFRIAQEAVNNAVKHAHPSRITITLTSDPGQMRLEIEDDGVGLRPQPGAGQGMGLHIMNYRARVLGAVFQIGPRAGGGTRVTCTLRNPVFLQPPSPAYVERT